MAMFSISTTYLADGTPDSTARLMSIGGDNVIEMSYEESMRMLEAARPAPDTPEAEDSRIASIASRIDSIAIGK